MNYDRLIALLVTVPLWPMAWMAIEVISVRLTLGYWPAFARPDPAELEPPLYPVLHIILLPLLLLSPLAALAALLVALRRWFTGRNWQLPLWTLVSFAVYVAWLSYDPGGFLTWWAD